MSDDELIGRLAVDLGHVRWPEPAQLRAQARRRTLRTVLVVPVVVLLVFAGAYVEFGHDRRPVSVGPQPAASSDTSSVLPSADPTAPASIPDTSATAGGPGIVTAGDPAWIPIDALLQEQDAGPGYHVDNDYDFQPGTYPTWGLDASGCPAYGGLHLSAYLRYRYMRGHTVEIQHPDGSSDGTAFVEARRLTLADAKQMLTDVQRVVHACPTWSAPSEASSDLHPAHSIVDRSVVGSGFAGDQSILVRQRITRVSDQTRAKTAGDGELVFAVVRVGDLVTVIEVQSDALKTVDQAMVRRFAGKAAARLCPVANPRC